MDMDVRWEWCWEHRGGMYSYVTHISDLFSHIREKANAVDVRTDRHYNDHITISNFNFNAKVNKSSICVNFLQRSSLT